MTKLSDLPLSRRDLFRVTSTYGITTTALAAAGLVGTATLPRLAAAAEETGKKRAAKTPKLTLRLGGAGWNKTISLIDRVGCLEFARDLEDRTDGAIRVEFSGDNKICNELDCVKKTQQGIIGAYTSATQNAAGSAPYYNVLDYAYMFQNRASMYHFLYHPGSNKLLREPLEKMHGLIFLFTPCELRGLMLGQKWRDKPIVKDVKDLAGTKNRVTGTQLGQIAMKLMGLNPVPLAWEETLDGLNTGLLDGAETWMSAAAAYNMTPVISQAIDLAFMAGTEHTAMSAKVFNGLSGDLQDAVLESAYFTQAFIQGANEASLLNTVGASYPSSPGTIFAKNKVRVVTLSPEALKKAEQMCSPEFNPKPWEQWRERLNGWAGGLDTYNEIRKIAREVPINTPAENIQPRRWWKS